MPMIRGEKLFEDALRAGVQRVADGGNVAGGVAGVLLILVRLGIVDMPVFLDRLTLLILVVERLLNQRIQLFGGTVGVAVDLRRPILLRIRYRIGRSGFRFSFFLPRAIRA